MIGLGVHCRLRTIVRAMSAERETVHAPEAPAAIGPYSHAVRSGELLFCSGQIPLDPRAARSSRSAPAAQARRCLENLEAVCAAAGTTLSRAVRHHDLHGRARRLRGGQRGLRGVLPGRRRRRGRPSASRRCRAAPASRSTRSSRSERLSRRRRLDSSAVSASTDTKAQIAKALANVVEEVPALAPLKLDVRARPARPRRRPAVPRRAARAEDHQGARDRRAA